MKIAYYPGCSGLGTSKEYEISTRAVCKALGLELQEIPDWSCCGSTPAHAMDAVLSAALCARNLSLAAKMDADCVLTPCPSCLSNLKRAKHHMEDEGFKAKVDDLLDNPCSELPESYSILQILIEKVGLEEIAKRVKKPLKGLKLANYYGCLMSRPADLMQFDSPENPMAMDNIMIALGAEVVPFPLKTECCGAAQGIPRPDITAALGGRLLERAKSFGANAMVAACPLCHMNIDLRQMQAEAHMKQKFNMPVFYYTQLMAIAFDLPEKDILLKQLAVDPKKLLATLGKESTKEGAA